MGQGNNKIFGEANLCGSFHNLETVIVDELRELRSDAVGMIYRCYSA